MRYMFLIYSREMDTVQMPEQEMAAIRQGHRSVQDEAAGKGVFEAAEPLRPTSTATTVRMEAGRRLVIDGPFAETKEQLGGYYILDCKDLDEAIEWAAKIPTACQGVPGCVEIRPIAALSSR